MYWPVGHVRALRTDHLTSENEPLIDFRLNRRTNLFITWTSGAITLWSSEPTCRISRLNRTQGSLEEYGLNRSVEWTADGHALYVSTTTNHILLYDLLETESPEAVASSLFSTQVPKINIDVPHILKSFPPGAGQGEVYDMTPEAIMTSTNIPELQLRNGGAVRLSSDIRGIAAIGGTSLPTAKKGLLIAIDHRGHPTDDETSGAPPFKGLLRLPSKIPEALVRKGSRSQPLPPYGWPYVDMDGEDQVDIDKWTWKEVGIDLAGHEDIAQFQATKMTLVYTVITTLGNAFLVFPSAPQQDDQPWWNKKMPVNRNSSWNSVQVHSVNLESTDEAKADNATAIGVNQPFGLCTVGTSRGSLVTVKLDHHHAITAAWTREYHDEQDIRDNMALPIQSLQWTSDGYALAVQSPGKWALYSPFGDLIFCDRKTPTETQRGNSEAEKSAVGLSPKISGLAWLPGNYGLMVLHSNESPLGLGLEIIPFAKSSSTMQQDHFCRYRSLVLHDEIRVFGGASYPAEDLLQASMDLFETVKVPLAYIIHQWPIRYTAVSQDGKLLACAGRNGLTHYSFSSGRWKLFLDVAEESSFTVRGGLVWFHHVLIAAVHVNGHSEIHLYSRDLDLDLSNALHVERIPHTVLLMNLIEDSLLVYTSDNILHHFLVQATSQTIQLHLCASISLSGWLPYPNRIKSISWIVPPGQKMYGNKLEDNMLASLLVLDQGRLTVLQRESKSQDDFRPVIISEQCQSYDGPHANANALWVESGTECQLILNTASSKTPVRKRRCTTRLPSYNRQGDGSLLAIVPHYGLAIKMLSAIDQTMSIDLFGYGFSPQPLLFLSTLLRSLISADGIRSAVSFAGEFAHLPYFKHVLELLLLEAIEQDQKRHTTMKSNNKSIMTTSQQDCPTDAVLPSTIEFLDHFPESQDAVIACARKCEAEVWPTLFELVGSPRDLFNGCLEAEPPILHSASSLLLISHTLDQTGPIQKDIVRLLTAAYNEAEYELCKDILRFASSIGQDTTELADSLATIT